MTDTTLRHGANVMRAVTRNLDPGPSVRSLGAPLDHRSARDAVTLLGWHGEATSETLQEALELSQPACVRMVDRLVEAGLAARHRAPGERRLRVRLTGDGERAAERLVRAARADVEQALRAALTDDQVADFVAALDRVAAVVFGAATDTVRFCRSCDVGACIGGGQPCPAYTACRANLEAVEG